MRVVIVNGLAYGVILSLGLTISACNTTKATVDTFVNFTSSTSPESLFTADGLVEESQKARLFTDVTFENLQQDIARGSGEYLTSLGVLLKVPPGDRDGFGIRSQEKYPLLFNSGDATSSKTLIALTRELEAGTDRNGSGEK